MVSKPERHAPTLVEVTDATTTGKNDGSATNDSAITLAKPLKAAKVFDYYTGALPEPQKGEPITIPLTGNAPIRAYDGSELATDAVYFKDYRILGDPKNTTAKTRQTHGTFTVQQKRATKE